MSVRTMDIGKNGMSLIGIDHQLATGQRVNVALEMFFMGKVRNVRARACVSHCISTENDGFKVGLQFLALDSRGAVLLAQYVSH